MVPEGGAESVGTRNENTGDYRKRIYRDYSSLVQHLSPEFDETSARRWARNYIRYIQDLLPPDKDAPILDVGCGSGRLLWLLKDAGFTDLTGVDISAQQVTIAQQVCSHVEHDNAVPFLQRNPGRFAMITGIDVIEHFRKEEVLDFLQSCRKALVPGGRLLLQTVNAESPWGLMHRYHDFTHEVCYDFAALSHLLTLSGFENAQPRPLGPVVHGVKSMVRFVAWRLIWAGLWAWNVAETGSGGTGVYTRIFMVTATARKG